MVAIFLHTADDVERETLVDIGTCELSKKSRIPNHAENRAHVLVFVGLYLLSDFPLEVSIFLHELPEFTDLDFANKHGIDSMNRACPSQIRKSSNFSKVISLLQFIDNSIVLSISGLPSLL